MKAGSRVNETQILLTFFVSEFSLNYVEYILIGSAKSDILQ